MKKVYRVQGMTCCGCSNSVEQAIKQVAPDVEVTADATADEVTVTGDCDEDLIRTAVEDAGFDFGGIV